MAKRIIVIYYVDPDSSEARAAEQASGVVRVGHMSDTRSILVEPAPGVSFDDALASIRAQPGVSNAEPDTSLRINPVRAPSIRP
ncbi:hypothetical protein FHW69_001231 [Luteibacter sp. Sphag1AF]|uniref:hypothetical protein n=1 Tax=Luteibacter sp. Sphag1AF TaxID=2587031 RepID=UPI00161F9C37|nr:hypothetical protein [Luteibacter sp. Sphag1AF]MBB3226641.1 hypothetical protein [Luteibacter sp. Sphag1AF]